MLLVLIIDVVVAVVVAVVDKVEVVGGSRSSSTDTITGSNMGISSARTSGRY